MDADVATNVATEPSPFQSGVVPLHLAAQLSSRDRQQCFSSPVSAPRQFSQDIPPVDSSASRADTPEAPPPAVSSHGAPRTSFTHPITISPLVPSHILPHLLAPSPPTSPPSVNIAPIGISPAVFLSPESPDCSFSPPGCSFGNMVLSSCPGKKIRLNVPSHLRSRPAVSRDLETDLLRARSVYGVRAIVCCLFDPELSLLGVSPEAYARTAADLGIDLIRLPILEGCAPEGPKQLDQVLDKVLLEYTLRGRAALVHCRGGVGRAGLVACAWLFKTGLVSLPRDKPATVVTTEDANTEHNSRADVSNGLLEGEVTRVDPSRIDAVDEVSDPQPNRPDDGLHTVRYPSQAAVHTVERAIDLVRKRRSTQAVETAAQVNFLFAYLDYLEGCKEQSLPAVKLNKSYVLNADASANVVPISTASNETASTDNQTSQLPARPSSAPSLIASGMTRAA